MVRSSSFDVLGVVGSLNHIIFPNTHFVNGFSKIIYKLSTRVPLPQVSLPPQRAIQLGHRAECHRTLPRGNIRAPVLDIQYAF